MPRDLVEPKIRRKLSGLRRSLRLHLAGEGLAWVALALGALVVVTFALDWGSQRITHQHMTVLQRALILLGCLTGVGVVAWRRLLSPLLVPMRENDLALVVERHYPALDDRLISALQFSAAGADTLGASDAMIHEMARQAGELAEPLRFTDPVRKDRLMRRLGLALSAIAVLGLFTAWQPAAMRTWLKRDLLLGLLGDPHWPQDTHLEVRGAPDFRTMRGGSLTLTVDAAGSKVVPAEVVLHMEFASVGSVEEVVPLSSPDAATYTRTFDAVSEPFRFYVTGNDDRTSPYQVRLVDAPELRDVAFTIDFPAYMRMEPARIAGDQGVLSIPPGSWVTVRGLANKDLAAASLFLENEAVGRCEIEPVAAEGGAKPLPRQVAGKFKLAPGKRAQPSLSLRVALTDSDSFTNPRGARYTVVLLKDREPAVQMTLHGIGGQITDKAMIPMTLAAKDDYGVEKLLVEFGLVGISEDAAKLPVREWTPTEKSVQVDHVVDLERLSAGMKPGESLVKVGESVRLVAAGQDAMPPPDGPNVGRSSPATLKIVSEQDLLAGLIQIQKAMREQFRQAMINQGEAAARTESARKAAGDESVPRVAGQPVTVAAETKRQAGESAKLQGQVAASVGTIADRFAQILQQLENNRVGTDDDKRRLKDRILVPMTELSGDPMKKVVADLGAAMDGKAAADVAKDMERIAGLQNGFYKKMESILAEMVQLESAQELERWLKVILDMSGRVKEKTEAERKERERELRDQLKKTAP